MSFRVGDRVIPVVDTQINDKLTLPTHGKIGEVVKRDLQMTNRGIEYYDYYVRFDDPFEYKLNGQPQRLRHLWFNDKDLGNLLPEKVLMYDIREIEKNLNLVVKYGEWALGRIKYLLGHETHGPFVGDIKNLLNIVCSHMEKLRAADVDEQQQSVDIQCRFQGGDLLIALELCWNLSAINDIIVRQMTKAKRNMFLTQVQLSLGRDSAREDSKAFAAHHYGGLSAKVREKLSAVMSTAQSLNSKIETKTLDFPTKNYIKLTRKRRIPVPVGNF